MDGQHVIYTSVLAARNKVELKLQRLTLAVFGCWSQFKVVRIFTPGGKQRNLMLGWTWS